MIFVRLREAMERFRRRSGQRITYRQLSEKSGISESTLQSISARSDYNTTLDTVDRIAIALDCPLDILLEHSSVSGTTSTSTREHELLPGNVASGKERA